MAKTTDAAAPAARDDFPPADAIESVDDSTLSISTRIREHSPAAIALAQSIIAAAIDGHTAVGPMLPGLSSKDVTTVAARIKRLVASVLRADNDPRRVTARVVTKGDGLAWGIKLVAPSADPEPEAVAE